MSRMWFGFLLPLLLIAPFAVTMMAPLSAEGRQQVWSLTQSYSVDFSQSRIGVKSAFSTNAKSRFLSVVDGVRVSL